MSYNQPPPPPGYGGQPGYGAQSQPQGTSVMAIISLVTGILGVLCCTLFVFSIAAVILGYLGRKEILEGKKTGNGLAMAGLILGGVGIALGVVIWVISIASGNYSFNYSDNLVIVF